MRDDYMKIAVANDHRGVKAIEQVKAIIAQLNHECVDFGKEKEQPIDYPDVAYQAAEAVSTKRLIWRFLSAEPESG